MEGEADGEHPQVCEALRLLSSAKVHELPAPVRDALLATNLVRTELDLADEPSSEVWVDRSVRTAIGKAIDATEVRDPAVAAFFRIWCDVPDARPSGDWAPALTQAFRVAFDSRAATVGGVRRAFASDRRTRPPWIALAHLAAVISAADAQPLRRRWIYGDAPPGPPSSARFVLLTAHHGTGLRVAGEKLCAVLGGAKVELIDFDAALRAAGAEYLGHPAGAEGAEVSPARQMAQVVALSRRVLQGVSRQAIEAEWPRVLAALDSGKIVVFACSTTTYHEKSGSISALVNDAAFIECLQRCRSRSSGTRDALRNAIAITLIDDVFDCFARLHQPGEPFDRTTSYQKLHSRSEVLLTLLEWRQSEIMTAEHLARLVGWRHLILPTKSPVETLVKLVDRAPIATVFHPATCIRPGAGGLGEGAELRRVHALVRALEAKRFAVVNPMAVDELRFSEAAASGGMLRPRWESLSSLVARAEELLWAPPPKALLAVAEQPLTASIIVNDPTTGPRDDSALYDPEPQGALELLQATLQRHVDGRVRLLVNQADGGIFVYRPYGGALAELGRRLTDQLTLRLELIEHEDRQRRSGRPSWGEVGPRPLVVYHPASDEQRRLANHVTAEVLNGGLRGVQLADGARVDQVFRMVESWAATWAQAGQHLTDAAMEAFRDGLRSLPGGELRIGRQLDEAALLRLLATALQRIRDGQSEAFAVYSRALFDDASYLIDANDVAPADLAALFVAAAGGQS